MYLLDTNVVSELRKGLKADQHVKDWASKTPSNQMFVSVISVLELEQGVLLKEHKDAVQGAVLRAWLQLHVLPAFAERILPVTLDIAQTCARLHVPDPRSDRDAMIGATAIVHGMTLVTRKLEDFRRMNGISLLNPWDWQFEEPR